MDIAVMGDRDSILGFSALGLGIHPVEEAQEARKILRALSETTAVIYITERLAAELAPEIDGYKDKVTPAIIVIPGKEGPAGMGMSALKSAVERAVGADILNT